MERSADEGDGQVQLDKAIQCCEAGDVESFLLHLHQAAAHGLPDALFELGAVYEHGATLTVLLTLLTLLTLTLLTVLTLT